MRELSIIRGGCLCGEVRYAIAGIPYQITHCHCVDCRRSSGAPFVTWATFRQQAFKFIKGTPKAIRWEGRVRGFCGDCGTQMTFMAEEGEVDITVGSFDKPEAIVPRDHTWTEDQLPWIKLEDGLPAYKEERREKVVEPEPEPAGDLEGEHVSEAVEAVDGVEDEVCEEEKS